jgi:hypothetical protein
MMARSAMSALKGDRRMNGLKIIMACIVVIFIGTGYIRNRKPRQKPGLEPVTNNLEIHPGFEKDQIILWNGGNGITVDKKDFKEEFLHMDVAEIYTELKQKREDNSQQK